MIRSTFCCALSTEKRQEPDLLPRSHPFGPRAMPLHHRALFRRAGGDFRAQGKKATDARRLGKISARDECKLAPLILSSELSIDISQLFGLLPNTNATELRRENAHLFKCIPITCV